MGVLGDLGLTSGDGGVMLIAPPDGVLAEAGRMKPRPSIASALQVAEPATRIAWWAERRFLTAPALSRLRWMIASDSGEAWIVFDPEEEGLTSGEVREAIASSPLRHLAERTLSTGDIAIRVGPRG